MKSVRLSRAFAILLSVLLLITLAISIAPATAQNPPVPITLGENTIGDITTAIPQPTFSFVANANQMVEIQVLAVTSGLAPTFTILNETGALVQAVGNPNSQDSISGQVTFPAAGTYLIQVASGTSTQGQFVLSVNDTTPTVPPTPLVIDEAVAGNLEGGLPINYAFRADVERVLELQLDGVNDLGGFTAELTLQDGTPIATLDSLLLGSTLKLPAGEENYLLTLNPNPELPIVAYELLLTTVESDAGDVAGTPEPSDSGSGGEVVLPDLPTTGACVLATQTNQRVNVRPGPGTNYSPPLTTISPFEVYSVVGRNSDTSWYVIDYGDGEGWIASSVTRTGGDCSGLAVQTAPPPPAATDETPTETVTPSETTTETETTTVTPSETTETPTEETVTPDETQEDTGQLAGDNSQTIDINIKNGAGTYTGAVSYPNGVNSDQIFINISGFDSITTSGDVTYTLTCTGNGAANVTATGISGLSCGTTTSVFYTNDSDNDLLTIAINAGENAFVNWTLVVSANN